jgi:hypothetical protein
MYFIKRNRVFWEVIYPNGSFGISQKNQLNVLRPHSRPFNTSNQQGLRLPETEYFGLELNPGQNEHYTENAAKQVQKNPPPARREKLAEGA